MDSLTLKAHNSFQNQNNRKAAHSLAPRLLIFKSQEELLKLNDISLNCSSPKTDLVTIFLNQKIEVL